MKRVLIAIALLVLVLPAKINAQSQGPGQSNPFDPNSNGLSFGSFFQYLETDTTLIIEEEDTAEGGREANLATLRGIWDARAYKNVSSSVNMFGEYHLALRDAANARYAAPNGACDFTGFQGGWKCVGPDSFPTQNIGRLKDLCNQSTGLQVLVV